MITIIRKFTQYIMHNASQSTEHKLREKLQLIDIIIWP